MRRLCVLAVLLSGITAPAGSAPKFYPDDPLWQDQDELDTPQQPAELELSDLYDRFSNIFYDYGSKEYGEAENVNSLDEVPDSSWFTNRHWARRLSIEELVRGPNTVEGPDTQGIWTIFRGKTQGLTPGFQILDSRGDGYVIKFNAPTNPELNSSSEVIATKIFYALGYNVPENYVAFMDPAKLRIKPGTQVKDRFGDIEPLTEDKLRWILRKVHREPNGTIRVTASKYLEGLPLGPHRYFETRSDDPNDVIPHEKRRELRGLRVFAAWLNHDDTRAQNSQDSWIEEGGQHYVRHYLLDLGSCFGSGSIGWQLPWLGYHYWMDLNLIKQNIKTFGFHTPYYHKVEWPHYPEYKVAGRFEAEYFIPPDWRNDYRNSAFVRMTNRDAFWAAKILMAFEPEELRALVKTGQISNPDEEQYFYQVLLKRQRKCGEYYFNQINPLDQFRVTGAGLEFTNLSEQYGFPSGAPVYRVRWHLFDNRSGVFTPLGPTLEQSERTLSIPPRPAGNRHPDAFLVAELYTLEAGHPAWNQRVSVYLRPGDSGYQVVGIERGSGGS